jgi:hypothetical protein
VTGPGIQANRARRGGWGREYVVTGPTFRPTGPGVRGEGGRGLLQTDPARHSWIST